MTEPLRLRVDRVPDRLVVVRVGAVTLDDERLAHACERCYDRWGIWGFSVLEVPGRDDYGLLVRLRPEVGQRRQLFTAEGHDLTSNGFPLLPTMDHPHWTVVLAEPTVEQFARVRRHFHGPIENPGWVRGAQR